MRLAVFTSHFPGRVNTFFARDMRALIDAGFDVEIFPLYPLDPAMWAFVPSLLGPDVLPRQRVHHLSLRRRPRAQWRPGSRQLPRLVRDGASVLAESLLYGPQVTAKNGYALAKAWLWATRRRRHDFDHVLAYWGNYAATAAYAFRELAAPGAPFSLVLHAGTDLYRQRVFLRRKLLEAARVFVVCEYNRTFLQQHYPDLFPRIASKVALHHLGLDLGVFACDVERPSDAPVIGVGSLEAAKGFDDLVRAAGCLHRRGSPVRVRLIGTGPEAPRLQALIRSEGVDEWVSLEGWQTPDAVQEAIGKAFALVHPSKHLGDAVPTVIKEAMALGTPVVASAIAGIPELLDGGQCGMLVPPSSPSAIAEALGTLRRDAGRRRQLALSARQHAEALFDIRRTGTSWADALRAATPMARPVPAA